MCVINRKQWVQPFLFVCEERELSVAESDLVLHLVDVPGHRCQQLLPAHTQRLPMHTHTHTQS